MKAGAIDEARKSYLKNVVLRDRRTIKRLVDLEMLMRIVEPARLVSEAIS